MVQLSAAQLNTCRPLLRRPSPAGIIEAAKTAGGKPPFEAAASYQEVLGELGRVHFILEFADLSAVERWLAAPPPAKIQEMMKQAPTLFPKCEDTLLRQLAERQQF